MQNGIGILVRTAAMRAGQRVTAIGHQLTFCEPQFDACHSPSENGTEHFTLGFGLRQFCGRDIKGRRLIDTF